MTSSKRTERCGVLACGVSFASDAALCALALTFACEPQAPAGAPPPAKVSVASEPADGRPSSEVPSSPTDPREGDEGEATEDLDAPHPATALPAPPTPTQPKAPKVQERGSAPPAQAVTQAARAERRALPGRSVGAEAQRTAASSNKRERPAGPASQPARSGSAATKRGLGALLAADHDGNRQRPRVGDFDTSCKVDADCTVVKPVSCNNCSCSRKPLSKTGAKRYRAQGRAYREAVCEKGRRVKCRRCYDGALRASPRCVAGSCIVGKAGVKGRVLSIAVKDPSAKRPIERDLLKWLRAAKHCASELRPRSGPLQHRLTANVVGSDPAEFTLTNVREHGTPGSIESCLRRGRRTRIESRSAGPFTAKVEVVVYRE